MYKSIVFYKYFCRYILGTYSTSVHLRVSDYRILYCDGTYNIIYEKKMWYSAWCKFQTQNTYHKKHEKKRIIFENKIIYVFRKSYNIYFLIFVTPFLPWINSKHTGTDAVCVHCHIIYCWYYIPIYLMV